MRCYKAYRFQMKPTKEQAEALLRQAGARRWVWNWALELRMRHYKETGEGLSYKTLSAALTLLKRQHGMEWLKECADAQALQQVLMDLCQAFKNHFNPNMKAGFPRFKSKKFRPTFRIPQRVILADGVVYVPKVGMIRLRQSRPIAEPIKSTTITSAPNRHWFISFTVEFEVPDTPLPPLDRERAVGLDLGLTDYLVSSDAAQDPEPNPKFFDHNQRRHRRAQRAFCRRQPGSNRRRKAARRVTRLRDKTTNQMKEFQHQLSNRIVRDHDIVCVETLNLRGLARTKHFGKSFRRVGFGMFKKKIEYKCRWRQKHFVAVDRFFPSSRLCNGCGRVNAELTLKDREWTCECGARHRRDFLAACNIRDEGLRILAVGQTDRQNAQGDSVRPGASGLESTN